MRMLVVDAFTDRPFTGNPAGVCLLDGPAEPGWMQRVAAEMRHSETAFVRPIEAPGADFELRWFTPVTEVALCGHATLASAHALYETGAAPAGRPIRLRTLRSGVLTVTRADGGGLLMDFPASPATETGPPPDLDALLGTEPLWVGRNSLNDLLVQVADEATVRGLAPAIDVLARMDVRGVIVTAAADPGRDHAFVSRFFGGGARRPENREDPVTGSAHCTLGPYWSERLGRTDLIGYQASARGGLVGVTVRNDRVELAGRAITVLNGHFHA
ncbi:PhzF family phenazine biosynthesis protein [Spirillospora sp. NPDC029432]|uniref:PhzF family phenazine biosynthesis protein n=1 Tax=Spirillospora sp. NPDC029432 TaxID=3154599 RepID=UPI0034549907